jgi:hypothetical protein
LDCSLQQLADVRDTKGKGTNLLAYLLQQVEDKEPGLLVALRRELGPVLSATLRERLNVAAEEAAMLGNGLKQIEEFICEIAPKGDASSSASTTTSGGSGEIMRNKKKSLIGSMKSPVALTKQMRNRNKIQKNSSKKADTEQDDRFYSAAKVHVFLFAATRLLQDASLNSCCVCRVSCAQAFVEEARPVVNRLQKEANECVARFGALAAYLCEAPDTDVLRILHDFCHQLEVSFSFSPALLTLVMLVVMVQSCLPVFACSSYQNVKTKTTSQRR